MKAEEVVVGRLFQSDQQLQIPIWQRRYSWTEVQWLDLWQDIERLLSGELLNHFIGSIVLKARPWSGLPSEAHQFLVVDGQQRVTTLVILITAIRDHIARTQATPSDRENVIVSYTRQLLVNADLNAAYRSRLLMQEPDASRLSAIIDGNKPDSSGSSIERAYDFFAQRILEMDRETAARVLATILGRMSAVWVTLETNDNAHRVFQTLNAGGLPLRQADLVRNYYFLLLDANSENFYRDHWRYMENDLDARDLEEYLVAWTITRGHAGASRSLFRYIQHDLAPKERSASQVLADGVALADAAKYFVWIRNPTLSDVGPALGALQDLARWGTLPAEGLLLWLLLKYADKDISGTQLNKCFEFVLSFLARRLLAGFEPQTHKSIFVATVHKMRERDDLRGADVVHHLRYLLSRGVDVRQWPSDETVLTRSLTSPLYRHSRSAWVFTVLERVNRSYFLHPDHAPALNATDYSIEHVMPQTLTPRWVSDLSSWGEGDPSEMHDIKLHVLGNLTITRINSILSNSPFAVKQTHLSDDWLRLNTDIAESHGWDSRVIDDRSRHLAEVATSIFEPPLSRAEIEEWAYELEITRAEDDLTDIESIEAELDDSQG